MKKDASLTLSQRMLPYNNLQGELSEIQSVQMGISFLTFQYHHSVVYLTRSSKQNHELCLVSARVAIRMLDKLVSNSMEVFNGIVWCVFIRYYLLYPNLSCFDFSPLHLAHLVNTIVGSYSTTHSCLTLFFSPT